MKSTGDRQQFHEPHKNLKMLTVTRHIKSHHRTRLNALHEHALFFSHF